MLPDLTVVLGGAASGKSAFAESLTVSSGLNPIYLATGRAFDAEMTAKIKLHQIRRGPEWSVQEVPGDLSSTLQATTPKQAVLLDCATMWLSNRLMAQQALEDAPEVFVRQTSMCPAPLIIVTNEVGQGIVPENAMARAFREAQGRLNIAIAGRADCVVQVVAGLPNVLKGTLP